jgi:hypothetical protein
MVKLLQCHEGKALIIMLATSETVETSSLVLSTIDWNESSSEVLFETIATKLSGSEGYYYTTNCCLHPIYPPI